MSAPIYDLRGAVFVETVDTLLAGMGRALKLEALAEVQDRLLHLLQVPSQLFRVDIEAVPGSAGQCRASLKLTDAGANLATALRARHVERLVVEEALGHPDLSSVWRRGEDAESPAGETRSAVKPGAAQ